jgi:hypothetical protein
MVHGEEPSQQWFLSRFAQTLSGTEIIRPEPLVSVDLW